MSLSLTAAGLSLNLVGAIVLAWGALPSTKSIEEIAASKWDFNPELRDALLKNRLRAAIGLVILMVGFICQLSGAIIA